MLAGSPPCSPQTPSASDGFTARARSIAIATSPPTVLSSIVSKGLLVDDAALHVAGQEAALGIVAGEAERRLGQIVRPEAEELGVGGDLAGGQAGRRQLDHRPDREHPPAEDPSHRALHRGAEDLELGCERDQRDHHLQSREIPLRGHLQGCFGDRPCLHLVNPAEMEPEPGAAGAEHRVDLLEVARDLEAVARELRGPVVPARLRRGELPLEDLGPDELVQRRIEEPDRDRQPVHREQDGHEVAALRSVPAPRARSGTPERGP